jgi:hypothetical protein
VSRRRGVLGRRALKLFLFIALALALTAIPACKRSTPHDAPAAARVTPAPAPAGLVAEIVVAHPDRTWDTVRAKLRATTSLVPSSPAVFLGGALGLPLGVLEQLDFNIPIVGAVVEEQGALAGAIAIHVKDGARVIRLMTTGSPRFDKDGKPNAETIHLVPQTPDPEGPSFAVSGNYLVIGRGKAVIDRTAPFLARTVAQRAMPNEDIVVTANQSALAGPISARLTQLWQNWKKAREADDVAMRQKHGGSAPDFGDPAEALADMDAKAGRFFAILGDFEEARLAVSIELGEPDTAERYRAFIGLKPRAKGPAADEIATMAAADLAPLMDLPSTTGIAFLTRDTAASRESSATSQMEAIAKVFGGRLAAADKTKIDSALRSFAKGRGDWLTGGIVASPSRAAVVRGAVSDASELDQSFFAMLDLLGVRAIAEPIANWIGDLKLSGVDAAKTTGDGAPRVVHVTRRPPKVKLPRDKSDKPIETDAFDVAWTIGKDTFIAAAGRDAKTMLAALDPSIEGAATLAKNAILKKTAARLGATVTFAVFADLARLGASTGVPGEDATLIITYGKDQGPTGRAFVELEAPSGLVMSYAAGASNLFGSSH